MTDANYPNPRIGAVIVLALVAAVIGIAWAGVALWRISYPAPAATVEAPHALRDSVQRSQILDSVRLEAWADSILSLRGDSLRAAWLARPARRLPGRIESLMVRDTVRDSLWIPAAAVRLDAVADSACIVRGDSLASELVQARFDASQCTEELAKRPTSCNGWSVFGAGVAVGSTVATTACVLAR